MRHTFFCIDGHTAGNPVRLVAGGAPLLKGASMSERRQDFLSRFDWIRTGLCFEPRGHDMMSGGFLYPPVDPANDIGILFIETSGCLPMCGHGTIGIITFGLEHGLIQPAVPGRLKVEVPAGTIDIAYERRPQGHLGAHHQRAVLCRRARHRSGCRGHRSAVGRRVLWRQLLRHRRAAGRLYRPRRSGRGAHHRPEWPRARGRARKFEPVHPLDPTIRGVSHVLWADKPKHDGADGRNAVFYGDKAIDRSPCGTGTSARLAHLVAKGKLGVGDRFVHESYICSRFIGRVEKSVMLGDQPAIIPSIEGSATATGFNTIWIDREDPFWAGFQVK
jgi:4-hydroxyproline epimerase